MLALVTIYCTATAESPSFSLVTSEVADNLWLDNLFVTHVTKGTGLP